MVNHILGLCAMVFAGALWFRAYLFEYRARERELRRAEERAAENEARAECICELYRRTGIGINSGSRAE